MIEFMDNTDIIEAAIQLSMAENVNREAPTPEKKRPGRPKKKLDIHEMHFFGVKDKSLISGNDIELIYTNPALFRNITAMFKSYMAKDVVFHFDAEGLTLYSKSHSSETSIYAQIAGSAMNYYYYNPEPNQGCGECKSVTFLMSQLTMERIFLNLSESEFIIAITFNHNTPDNIDIVMRDLPYQNTVVLNVIVAIPLDLYLPPPDTDDYPVELELSHDFLKSKINSIQKLGENVLFQKSPTSQLDMVVNGRTGVNIKTMFNEKRVALKSRMTDKTLIAVLQIEQLRPFTSNNKGDNVIIALDYDRPAMFRTAFDPENGSPAILTIFAKLKTLDIQ